MAVTGWTTTRLHLLWRYFEGYFNVSSEHRMRRRCIGRCYPRYGVVLLSSIGVKRDVCMLGSGKVRVVVDSTYNVVLDKIERMDRLSEILMSFAPASTEIASPRVTTFKLKSNYPSSFLTCPPHPSMTHHPYPVLTSPSPSPLTSTSSSSPSPPFPPDNPPRDPLPAQKRASHGPQLLKRTAMLARKPESPLGRSAPQILDPGPCVARPDLHVAVAAVAGQRVELPGCGQDSERDAVW